ncbi:COP9 signalosome [Cladochytrium replicatum]|nr:COP9 signalosome [Cladochytrium replicatum]
MEDVNALNDGLRKELANPKADLRKCESALTRIKILLVKQSALQPVVDHSYKIESSVIARDSLELGALWAAKDHNIPAFERYILQLKAYYADRRLPPSPQMLRLLGLNLLRLLAQNRISEFHTELEQIDAEEINSVYIKHPVEIEQSLMEGSYNKVWKNRSNVPAEEYLFFIDILMKTIRHEIASCSEKAYSSLPISDAATLLYITSQEDLLSFVKERNWLADQQKVFFTEEDSKAHEIPAGKIIRQTLNYARDLERIV